MWDKTAQTWPSAWHKNWSYQCILWLWVTSTSLCFSLHLLLLFFLVSQKPTPHRTRLSMALSRCSFCSWASVRHGACLWLGVVMHSCISVLFEISKGVPTKLGQSGKHTQIIVLLVCVVHLMIYMNFWTALLGLAFWDSNFISCAWYRVEFSQHLTNGDHFAKVSLLGLPVKFLDC